MFGGRKHHSQGSVKTMFRNIAYKPKKSDSTSTFHNEICVYVYFVPFSLISFAHSNPVNLQKNSGVVTSEGLSFDDYFINGKCAPDFVATSFPGHSELGLEPCTYHGA